MRILIFIILLSSYIYAQWPSTPDINLQVSRLNNVSVSNPSVVTDDNNGAIIGWLDTRKGTSTLFVQRVDQDGILVWDSSGVEITTDSVQVFDYSMMEDGTGGAFLVWTKKGDPWFDIYAQRIDAAGQRTWGDTGIVVCNAAWSQVQVKLASDDNGGFITCWTDYRWSTYADIFAQRIDPNGQAYWKNNGVVLNTDRLEESVPEIIADGFGGAVVTWWSWNFDGEYLYAQRISADDSLLWGSDGRRVSNL
jgi:hypothetical protein